MVSLGSLSTDQFASARKGSCQGTLAATSACCLIKLLLLCVLTWLIALCGVCVCVYVRLSDIYACILQFLDSYKSVTLDSMAQSFGVSVDFIDRELADFIVSNRLTAKIDKVGGVVETNRCANDQRLHLLRFLWVL